MSSMDFEMGLAADGTEVCQHTITIIDGRRTVAVRCQREAEHPVGLYERHKAVLRHLQREPAVHCAVVWNSEPDPLSEPPDDVEVDVELAAEVGTAFDALDEDTVSG